MRQIILLVFFCIIYLGFGQAAERFRRGYVYHRPRHYDEIESDYDGGGGGDNDGSEGGYRQSKGGHSDVEGGYSGGGGRYSVVEAGYSGSRKEHSAVWGGYSGGERRPSGRRGHVYGKDESIYSGGNGDSEGGNSGVRGGNSDVEGGYSGGDGGFNVVREGYSGGGKENSGVWGGYNGFDRVPSGSRGVFSSDGSIYSGVGVRNSGGGGEYSSSVGENNDKGGYDDKSGNGKYGSGGEKVSGNGNLRDYLRSVQDAAYELKQLILSYLTDQEKATGKEKEIETNSDDENSGFSTTGPINVGSRGNAEEAGLSIDKNGGGLISGIKKEHFIISDSHQSEISSVKVVEITTDSSHNISKGHEGSSSEAEKVEYEEIVFSRGNGRHGGSKDAGSTEKIKYQTGGFKGVFGDKYETKNVFNSGGRFASDNYLKVNRDKGEADAVISFGYGGDSGGRVGDRKDGGFKGAKPGIYCGEMGCNHGFSRNGLARDEETGLEKSIGFVGEGSERIKYGN